MEGDATPDEIKNDPRPYLTKFLHFLSRERKRRQKKTPVSRLTLRVVDTDGARRGTMGMRTQWHFEEYGVVWWQAIPTRS